MTDTELILKRLDEIEARIKMLQLFAGCSDERLDAYAHLALKQQTAHFPHTNECKQKNLAGFPCAH